MNGDPVARAAAGSTAVAPRRAGAPRARRAPDARVELQPAFVLHSYPWRETSLIVDLLSRDHGRVAVVARGAKRPTSQFRGLLGAFSPLSATWSGRAEIKTLIRAEWVGGLVPLRGDRLLEAFYLNELLVRLLARGDPHEEIFFAYARTLRELSLEAPRGEQALRGFELDLLRAIGVAPSFEHGSDGAPTVADAWYRVDPEHGVQRIAEPQPGAEYCVRGPVMQALARRDLAAMAAAPEARALLRQLIGYHLRGRPLNTHRILADLRRI